MSSLALVIDFYHPVWNSRNAAEAPGELTSEFPICGSAGGELQGYPQFRDWLCRTRAVLAHDRCNILQGVFDRDRSSRRCGFPESKIAGLGARHIRAIEICKRRAGQSPHAAGNRRQISPSSSQTDAKPTLWSPNGIPTAAVAIPQSDHLAAAEAACRGKAEYFQDASEASESTRSQQTEDLINNACFCERTGLRSSWSMRRSVQAIAGPLPPSGSLGDLEKVRCGSTPSDHAAIQYARGSEGSSSLNGLFC